MAALRASVPPPPLITEDDIRDEISRLFGAAPESGLVIRVYGLGATTAANDAIREMLASLRMYEGKKEDEPFEIFVEPPGKAQIAQALAVIGLEEHQKRVLDCALTTFGRRLTDPLATILDSTPTGSVMARLSLVRDLFLAQIGDLRMTPESQRTLSSDVRKLLSDEYLAKIAENEERVQRPKVARLAQQILRLVGSTFHRALKRWPAHAERIAASIAERGQGRVRLGDVPFVLRTQIIEALEEFLWVETGAELERELQAMLAEHQDVMPVSPAEVTRSWYREIAEACWAIIAEHC